MYKITVFNQNREVIDSWNSYDYPEEPPLEDGQWIDICRIDEDLDVSCT